MNINMRNNLKKETFLYLQTYFQLCNLACRILFMIVTSMESVFGYTGEGGTCSECTRECAGLNIVCITFCRDSDVVARPATNFVIHP